LFIFGVIIFCGVNMVSLCRVGKPTLSYYKRPIVGKTEDKYIVYNNIYGGNVVARKKVEDVVQELALPILDELQYELVDVEYIKEGNNWYLRIYIDKPGGVTIDDCQRASEKISDKLDEIDPIPHNYFLEVSSPGIDRPLKKDKDFERYKGYKVDVKLYKPLNGKKQFTGELLGLEDDNILVSIDKNVMSFKRNEVAVIRLAVEF